MENTNGRRALKLIDVPNEQLPDEQTYQAKLRQAIYDVVGEDDVREIVKGIVKRAKEGDKAAVSQFFDFVVGSRQAQRIVVNNTFASIEDGARRQKRLSMRSRTF